MKIKINPFYIICVIIFELIMINFLFIVIFLRNNNTDSIINKGNKPVAIQNKAVGKDKQIEISPKSQQVKISEKKKLPEKMKVSPKKKQVPKKVNQVSAKKKQVIKKINQVPEKKKQVIKKANQVPKKIKQAPEKQKPATKKESLIGISAKKRENQKVRNNCNLIDRFFNINRNNNYSGFLFAKKYLLVEKNDFIATAYDLSYRSCGKYPGHPAYGITFSGTKAVKGRTIAVDPEVIPLGSKVYVEFPKEYQNLDGWYVAEDTGNKVKGKIIDVFLGKSALKEAMEFGRRKVKLKIQVKVPFK
ncbi:MAG TPA: 3D domain-containing protein [Clostridia bacterium]|nr:3D domain-containing protein [Clostridia bacterium]